MKKILTLLSVMMLFFVLGANAQDRKTWDFTKGVSDETRAQLDADPAQWTRSANSEGVSTGWVTISAVEGELTAGGKVIKEFAGLNFSQFAAGNAVNYLVTKLRLQKNCSFTINGLKAGQKIELKAQSANATAVDRGFGFDNAAIIEGPEDGKVLGRDAEGAPEGGVTRFLLTVQADGAVQFSTGVNGAPASGVEILSIIIDEGDKNIKKWDFSAWSEATQTQVCGAEDWTTAESASKDYITGNEIRWINTPTLDANNDLTAGGAAIAEMMGLRYEGLAQYGIALAFDYGTTLDTNKWGPYAGGKYIWVCNAADKIIVPNVKSGSTLKLGVESHKPGDARGFKLTVNGNEIAAAQTTDAYAVLEYAIPAGDEEYVDVALVATKGCHLYSIEAEVKDEAFVDKNPKLGSPKFNIDGTKKMKPESEFTITFPASANIALDEELKVLMAITKEGEEVEAGLMSGNLNDGIVTALNEWGVEEQNTKYVISIFGYECAGIIVGSVDEENPGEAIKTIEFETAGKGIEEARSWAFHNDDDMAAALATSVDSGAGYWAASSKGRYSYAKPVVHSELMLDDETKYPNTEGLYFTMNTANDILVGTPAGNNDRLQLGGGVPTITIPSCSAGDIITVKALWSTKNSGVITITNGTYGEEGVNVINLTDKSVEYAIKVTSDDDVALASKNVVYQAISILPAKDVKEEVTISVVAKAGDEVLATLLEPTTVKSGSDPLTGGYSYWLKGSDDLLYTAGAKGSPFEWNVATSKDVDYAIEYKKATAYPCLKKVVYCSEAENIEGAVAHNEGNAPIRASNRMVAYNEGDITLCTIPAGTYRIAACIWDITKGGGVTNINLTAGEENQITLVSNGDNMSYTESDTFTVTADTPVIWTGTTEAGHCLDAIVVYEYDETLGISNAAVSASKSNVVKVIENGQFLIKTAKGTFSATGAQVK